MPIKFIAASIYLFLFMFINFDKLFIFYLLFTLIGEFIQTEVQNNKGRADAVVKTADSIYVFEFKMDNNATAEAALAQINSKDYAIPYTADHRKIVKIGVEFSQTERGIKRWLIECTARF